MLVKAVNLVAAFLILSQVIFFHLSFASNSIDLAIIKHEGCEMTIGFFAGRSALAVPGLSAMPVVSTRVAFLPASPTSNPWRQH